MPARSEAQRRLLYARFGSEWVHKHGFANKGKLPEHVKPKAKKKPKKKAKKKSAYGHYYQGD